MGYIVTFWRRSKRNPLKNCFRCRDFIFKGFISFFVKFSSFNGFKEDENYLISLACFLGPIIYNRIVKIASNITKRVYQKDKNLNIIGEGKVTLHIQTSDKEYNDIYFGGSQIISGTLNTDAKKGSSKIVLTDASKVRKNDLIKIWKNIP